MRLRRTGYHWLAGMLALVIFSLAYFSPVSYATSDPELSLLVSQAILEHGVVYLDAYQEALGPVWEESVMIGELVEREGHWYYYFPLGPSLFSLPLVWLANQRGWDMANVFENHALQNVPSALVCAAVFLLLFQVCRCYLEEEKPRRFSETYGVGASLVIATVSVMGSALISTMGTAWWNLDLGVLFITSCLWLLARYDSGRAGTIHPYWLGFLLCAVYVCRPSAAVFVAVTLVTVFFWVGRPAIDRRASEQRQVNLAGSEARDWEGGAVGGRLKSLLRTFGRGEFWMMAGSAAVWLAGYLVVHRAWTGQWMGDYTAVARFMVRRAPLWVALYGHFFSPARGLLVYSPFFGLVLLGVWRLWRRPLVWLVLAWLVLTLLVTAGAAPWWGGWSYGPRLLTEVMPGLVLLSALVWRDCSARLKVGGRRAAVAAYLALGAWAIFVNSYQGLFNVSTMRWDQDVYPLPVEGALGDLFDWRYPQFLATNEMICEWNREKMERVLALEPPLLPYRWGQPVRFDADREEDVRLLLIPDRLDRGWRRVTLNERDIVSKVWFPVPFSGQGTGNRALFIGWTPPEAQYRWSQCSSARIVWRLGAGAMEAGTYRLQITAGGYEDQEVVVLMNGVAIGTVFVPKLPPTTVTLPFDGELLRPGEYNEIAFWFERPVVPGWKDSRALGMALVEWRIGR